MATGDSTITTIFGTDEGLVSDHARKLFDELTEGTNEFSHEVIEGNASDSEMAAEICQNVIQALQTMPMFPGRKVVWLKNTNFLGDSVTGKAEATTMALQILGNILEHELPQDLYLMVSATEFDKRRVFNKLLISKGQSYEYRKPDISQDGWESEVASLAKKAAADLGLQFEHAALDLFIHCVSESSRQIVSEISKLDIYLGPERRTITEKDILEMVPITRSGIIFEISRTIENAQAGETIKLIDAQMESGEQPVALIRAAIIPTLRNLLAAKILSEECRLNPINYKEFTSQVNALPSHAKGLVPLKKDGTPNVYPLFLATQKVKRFKLPQLKKALKECFEADKSLVSSSTDARLILHRLAICIAS